MVRKHHWPPCARAPPLTPPPPTCGTSLPLHAVPPPRMGCRGSKLACSQTPLRGKRAHAPIQVPMAALWNNSSYHLLAHRTTGIHSKCTLSHNFACSTGPISDSTSFATSGFWSSPSDHANLVSSTHFLYPNLIMLGQHGACATDDSPDSLIRIQHLTSNTWTIGHLLRLHQEMEKRMERVTRGVCIPYWSNMTSCRLNETTHDLCRSLDAYATRALPALPQAVGLGGSDCDSVY